MIWKKRNFSTFSLNDCCDPNLPVRCETNLCAHYDESSNRIVDYVTVSGVPAYQNESGGYLFQTCNGFCEDVSKVIPCCYQLTISNVANYDISDSWCLECDELNGTYYCGGSLSRFYTILCTYHSSYINNPGTITQKYFTKVCETYSVFDMKFILASAGPPPWTPPFTRIVAVAGFSSMQSVSHEQNLYGTWIKTIASYDPSMYKNGVYYTDLDCRNFSITFGPEDANGLVNIYPKCDFSGASFSFSPISTDSNYKTCDEYIARNYYYCKNEPYYGECDQTKDLAHNYSYEGQGLLSSKAIVTIDGVVGIDDGVDDEDLTADSCKLCTDINGSFIFSPLDDQLGEWSRKENNEAIVNCCECDAVNSNYDGSCIYTKLLLSGDTAIVRFYNPYNDNIYAEFRQTLPINEEGFIEDCDGLLLDSFSLYEHNFSNGNDPYPRRRCDFSNATVSVQFGGLQGSGIEINTSYEIGCPSKMYECTACWGGIEVPDIQVTLPALTWQGNYNMIVRGSWPDIGTGYFAECTGNFGAGSYILEHCSDDICGVGLFSGPEHCEVIYRDPVTGDELESSGWGCSRFPGGTFCSWRYTLNNSGFDAFCAYPPGCSICGVFATVYCTGYMIVSASAADGYTIPMWIGTMPSYTKHGRTYVNCNFSSLVLSADCVGQYAPDGYGWAHTGSAIVSAI